MIYVSEGKESMQRSVDRRCDTILPEGRERVITNHLIFVSFATVLFLELFEAIEV